MEGAPCLAPTKHKQTFEKTNGKHRLWQAKGTPNTKTKALVDTYWPWLIVDIVPGNPHVTLFYTAWATQKNWAYGHLLLFVNNLLKQYRLHTGKYGHRPEKNAYGRSDPNTACIHKKMTIRHSRYRNSVCVPLHCLRCRDSMRQLGFA